MAFMPQLLQNFAHLSWEDLEIEFEVRNIVGSLDEKKNELRRILSAEADPQSQVHPPNRPHPRARRQPRREVLLLKNKLVELHAEVLIATETLPVDINACKLLYVKTIHVASRIDRLAYSKAVRGTIPSLQASVHKIGEFLCKSIEGGHEPSTSDSEIPSLDLNIPNLDEKYADGFEDEVSDESDVDQRQGTEPNRLLHSTPLSAGNQLPPFNVTTEGTRSSHISVDSSNLPPTQLTTSNNSLSPGTTTASSTTGVNCPPGHATFTTSSSTHSRNHPTSHRGRGQTPYQGPPSGNIRHENLRTNFPQNVEAPPHMNAVTWPYPPPINYPPYMPPQPGLPYHQYPPYSMPNPNQIPPFYPPGTYPPHYQPSAYPPNYYQPWTNPYNPIYTAPVTHTTPAPQSAGPMCTPSPIAAPVVSSQPSPSLATPIVASPSESNKVAPLTATHSSSPPPISSSALIPLSANIHIPLSSESESPPASVLKSTTAHQPAMPPVFARRNVNFSLSFDGLRSGIPVDRFLFRFEKLAEAYGVRSAQMVAEMLPLLKGIAAEHYWSILEQSKGDVPWDTMKEKFRDRFHDPRQDVDILRAIHNRQQQRGESFAQFFGELQNMTIPLDDPIREKDFIILLQRNMSSELQMKLAGESFSLINDLYHRCVAIEESWELIKRKFAPKRLDEVTVSHSEPTAPSVPPTEVIEEALEAFRFSNNGRKPGVVNPTDAECWNCTSVGHRFADCPHDLLHKFCFRCGTPDVIKPTCTNPKCPGKLGPGNPTGEKHLPGTAQTPHTTQPRKPVYTDEAATATDPEFFRLLRNQQHQ